MPTDAHDAQDYTANGPTDIGFRTGGDGKGITNGVVAIGTECGVFGHSKDGIGVKGVADEGNDGVFGSSHTGRGVEGSSHFGIGVNGESTEDNGVVGSSSHENKSGVFGFHRDSAGIVFGVSGNAESRDGAGVNGFSNQGVGVRGFSALNDAVVGTSGGEKKSGVFGVHLQSTLPGFGVSGRTDSAQGVAVDGFSKNGGIGVRGSSDTGTGGVFSSDNSAQINLVPKLGKLPRDGKAGDLLVINGPIDPGDPGLIGAILHVCLRSSDSQDPAMWGKVVFQIASD
jgi:hypothetical protein